ncbi:hypothetical protein D6D54_05995 [Spiroplasma poulsonii]|uniref:DDE Tnp4 domain-containing protein n=1 Tax=Spiroplasma poulsonii TaxID=2138 RepID=A0A433EQ94_9MOLU|nr:hypothetical protein D6D54_05995 [Spiroplasma poulsonii]
MKKIFFFEKIVAIFNKKYIIDLIRVKNPTCYDATETPIQRSKKRQKQSYSGKKKKHTIKTQVIIEQETKKLLQQVFRSEKNMIMLYLKNQKSQF